MLKQNLNEASRLEKALPFFLVRLHQVERLTGLKKSSIYNRLNSGDFPRPVSLGPRAIAWRSDELFEWIASRPRVEQEV